MTRSAKGQRPFRMIWDWMGNFTDCRCSVLFPPTLATAKNVVGEEGLASNNFDYDLNPLGCPHSQKWLHPGYCTFLPQIHFPKDRCKSSERVVEAYLESARHLERSGCQYPHKLAKSLAGTEWIGSPSEALDQPISASLPHSARGSSPIY
jgi:hypothetical protein